MSRTKTALGWLLAISLGSFGAVAVAGGQDTDKPMHEEHQQQTPQQGSTTKQPAQETQKQTQQAQPQGQQMAANVPINSIPLKSLEESEVSSLQQKLKDMGLYRGEVDGKVGPLTRGALQRFFQRQAQLAGRGLIEQDAIAAFDIDVSDRVPVRGMEEPQGQQQTPKQMPEQKQAPEQTPKQTPQQAPKQAPKETEPPETEY